MLVTAGREEGSALQGAPRRVSRCHCHPHASPLHCGGGTSPPLLLQRTSGTGSSWLQSELCSFHLCDLSYLSARASLSSWANFPEAVCKDSMAYGVRCRTRHPHCGDTSEEKRHTPWPCKPRVLLRPSTLVLEHETSPKPRRRCWAHHPHFAGEQTEARREYPRPRRKGW